MSAWERVTELFEGALALPPEERDDFLDRHCAADAALRAEIESLLAAYGPGQIFFEGLESEVVGPALGGLLGGPAAMPPGTTLGAYQIEGSIGGGGMGVVYRARDHRLGRTVALKFIAPDLTHDRGARDRLLREARAAAALDDPRICGIHAIEEAPDGRLFLVMPYYAGETLKERLARGPFPASEAIELAIEVAEGLSRAHRAGIIHRDVKPANVLVTDEGAVKILDFGVAKLTTGVGLTRTGATVGTAAYMAPEQVRGEPADPRSDVWSLGVMLYEMLAGDRPFRGESESAVLYAVLESSPEPLRTHRPSLPDALYELVDELLSKDRGRRPSDAGAAADHLRRISGSWLSGAERRDRGPEAVPPMRAPHVAGAPSSVLRRMGTLLAGSWRRTVLTVLLAGLFALAAVEAFRGNADPSPPSDTIAVLPFVVRGDPELEYLRDGLVHLLSTKLDGIGDLRAVDPHALLATIGDAPAAPDPAIGRTSAARFGAQAFILGTVLRIGSGIELSASLYGADGALQATATAMAMEEAGLAVAIDELVSELVAHRLADAGASLAGIAAMTTRSLPALRAYLEGEELLRGNRPAAAITALRTAVEIDSTFSLAWYRLARAAGWIGPRALNEDATERAVRHGGALPGRTRDLVSAYLVFRTGDPVEAERLYRSVLTRYPADMEGLELLGETLFHNNPFLGRPTAEAREPLEQALAMDPGNREVMVHLMDLAAREGRAMALDTLTARYLRTEPGDEIPTALHAYAAMRDLVLEPPARHDDALASLAAAGPAAIFDALVRVAPQLGDPVLSDKLAALLTDPSYPAAMRATGHLHRAWFAVAAGRWTAAEPHWRAAESIQPGWTLVQRVLVASLPHSPTSPTVLAALRNAVEAWAPGMALEDGQHEGDIEVVRDYLLGLLDWRAGDDAGLERALERLAARPTAGSAGTDTRRARNTPDLALALAATLEALSLWRADRPTDAIAALDRAQLRVPFHQRARSPLLEQHLNRFLTAELLRAQAAGGGEDAAAADRDALRWYASLEDGYFHWGAPFLAPALIAAAEIHERHGRADAAAAAYERLLTLWNDPDPGLLTWIDLANERLEQIRRAGS